MSQLDEDAAFPDVVKVRYYIHVPNSYRKFSINKLSLLFIHKYTTIISAFARKRDLNGAEALLHRMVNDFMHTKDKRVMPDVPLFDNVIKAFTTPDFVSSSSAFRAESLMRNMWYLYTDCGVNVRPKGTTYKHVIIGFKKAGMALRADEMLWEMEHKSVGKPPKELIQTVMNAWHDSSHPDKQKRINALRLFMNDRFAKVKA
jgi:pentatricopeptide repeat protein